MRTLTVRKAALVAALPLALSSLAACGTSSSHQQPHRQELGPARGEDR